MNIITITYIPETTTVILITVAMDQLTSYYCFMMLLSFQYWMWHREIFVAFLEQSINIQEINVCQNVQQLW